MSSSGSQVPSRHDQSIRFLILDVLQVKSFLLSCSDFSEWKLLTFTPTV